MPHHNITDSPDFQGKDPLFINDESYLANPIFQNMDTVSALSRLQSEPDNVRVYLPMDISRRSVLLSLDHLIASMGDASEKNEFEYSEMVGDLIAQLEIYDQIHSQGHIPDDVSADDYHSPEVVRLAEEIVKRLKDIPDACTEMFPFEEIDELTQRYNLPEDPDSNEKVSRPWENDIGSIDFYDEEEAMRQGAVLKDGQRYDCAIKASVPPHGAVVRLHLELTNGFFHNDASSLDLNDEDRIVLTIYGKAEQGISRDILVPGTMNLHALHFVLQQLFGWQNSHFHHFSLTNSQLKLLTDDCCGEYFPLCGVLFRYYVGDDNYADAYWEDSDGLTEVSEAGEVRKWLKKRYRRPFRDRAVIDTWLGNRWRMEDDMPYLVTYLPEMPLEEILGSPDMTSLNELMENIRIGDLMCAGSLSEDETRAWLSDAKRQVSSRERRYVASETYLSELHDQANDIIDLRYSLSDTDSLEWPDTYEDDDMKAAAYSCYDLFSDIRLRLSRLERKCMDHIHTWDAAISPLCSELDYFYDYGDGWRVRITVEDVYTHDALSGNSDDPEAMRYLSGHGLDIDEDLAGTLSYVEQHEKPVCLQADGLPVCDDCGGIHGYINMLSTIHGEDRDEARSMKDWAREKGWTGRMRTPEKML